MRLLPEKVPLEIDHIYLRSRGGSDWMSNLRRACHYCDESKGLPWVAAFLVSQPEHLHRRRSQAQPPLRDGAAANSTRWALFQGLKVTGLAVAVGRGGRPQ